LTKVVDWKNPFLRLCIAPALFALICIFSFTLNFYLDAKETKMRTEWDMQHIKEKAQVENASAKTLKDMAVKIGIDLESEKVHLNPPDFEVESKKLEKTWDELSHHVRAEAVASGTPDPIPEETESFLNDSQEKIREIKKHLVREKPATWHEHSAETEFFSTLKGILRLHHVLAADSLLQLMRGDAVKAETSLTACWKLTESLRWRKEPTSVFVALKCSSIQMGLTKKLPSVPDVWQIRFRALDYRKALTAALSVETTRFFDALDEKSVRRKFLTNELPLLPEWGKQPAAVLLDPYLRMCRLNYLASENQLIIALQNSKIPADAPKRENHLLSDYLHEYESMNTTLLEFEKKQRLLDSQTRTGH
jgi:hypothetical protein